MTEKRERVEKEKVRADVCIHFVGGSRLFAEQGGYKRWERERETERVGLNETCFSLIFANLQQDEEHGEQTTYAAPH